MTMKTMIGGMIVAVALAFTMPANADVLLWTVDKDSEVVGAGDQSLGSLERFLIEVPWTTEDIRPKIDTGQKDEHGNPIYTYGNGKPDSLIVARVNVWNPDSDPMDYPPARTMENIHGNVVDESWKAPVDIGHPNASSGVGSIAASQNLNSSAANLNEYYQVAIMTATEGEWNGQYIYNEIAWSAWYSGSWLEHNGSYDLQNDGTKPFLDMISWTPDIYYTYKPVPKYDWHGVPEPTTGLLALIGLGFLGLTRIRKV
jgi:hypothetical protein